MNTTAKKKNKDVVRVKLDRQVVERLAREAREHYRSAHSLMVEILSEYAKKLA